MIIKDIRTLKELVNYEEHWDVLLEKCPGSVHTQSYAWIYAFFRHTLKAGEKWICLFAYNDHQLVAVYPLIINRRIGIPGFCFQTFRTPYDIYHTIRVDGLIIPGKEIVLELLITYLRKSFKAFPLIHIPGIPEFSPSLIYFRNKNKKLGLYKNHSGAEDFISLPESHKSYLSGLKTRSRKEISRRFRKLNSIGNVSLRLRDSQRTNEENLEVFKRIESSGWKGVRKTAIKARPGDTELYLSATTRFYEKGWMQWNFLELNAETIAAKLFVRINDVTLSWKTAYNEDYSEFGPGKLLFYKCIEDFYDRREIGEINFMNENKWFREWNVSKRPLYSVAIFPGSFFLMPVIKFYLRKKYG